MGLRLHEVAPRRGWHWFADGMRLTMQRPMAFTGLFVMCLMLVMFVMLLPAVGGLLGMGLMPLLTLVFMIASRAALRGEAVQPLQMLEGLGMRDGRNLPMLLLCAVYGLASIGTLELAHAVDGGSFERLQMAMAGGEGKAAEVTAEMADPRLLQGMVVRFGLASLLSVPFWFAPALVYWGHQGAWQALFSSTLALWRAKGAFAVYSLAWFGAMAGVGVVAALLMEGLGLRQLAGLVVVPAGLLFSVAFYVSLWFSWADCFGGDEAAPPAGGAHAA